MFAEKLKVKLAQAKEKYSKISANNVAVKAQVGAIHCDEFGFCFVIEVVATRAHSCKSTSRLEGIVAEVQAGFGVGVDQILLPTGPRTSLLFINRRTARLY